MALTKSQKNLLAKRKAIRDAEKARKKQSKQLLTVLIVGVLAILSFYLFGGIL